MRFFQGTQERVRNSRGKRAISVRATEVLLYYLNFKQILVQQGILDNILQNRGEIKGKKTILQVFDVTTLDNTV